MLVESNCCITLGSRGGGHPALYLWESNCCNTLGNGMGGGGGGVLTLHYACGKVTAAVP